MEPSPLTQRDGFDSPKDLLYLTVGALSAYKRKRMKGVSVEVHGHKHWTFQVLAAWPFMAVFAA